MRTVKNEEVQSKEVVFEPGNCTRYHLVLTKIRKDTLVVADINREKTVLLNPQFPSVKEYYYAFHRHGYSSSCGYAMAEFIVKELAGVTDTKTDEEMHIFLTENATEYTDRAELADFATEHGYVWSEEKAVWEK